MGISYTRLRTFMQQCYQFDADLHRDYLAARRMGKSGGGGKANKQGSGSTPPKP